MRKHWQGSNFPEIPKILASMGSEGAWNFGEIWSLSMFSHPMLRKCCQAQISPKFLKPEMRKHWQGSNFPKILKILASMGSAGAIVAQILGILEKFDPCQCFRISSFRNFGEIWSLSMFSHRRLPTSHDPLLSKSRFRWIMGGAWAFISRWTDR